MITKVLSFKDFVSFETFFGNLNIVLYSTAVDFAKNGVSAPQLTRELRPQKYPHYMEKRDKATYQSNTILGKLYDEIQCYKTDLNIDEEEEIAAYIIISL